MKSLLRPRQLAPVGLGLAMALAPAARAGDLFCGHKLLGHHKKTAVAATVGGPVYMPVSAPPAAPAPVATVGLAVTAAGPVCEHNPLATAHEAEVAMVRHERAKAALRAEVEASQRILQRMTSTDCNSCPKPSGDLTDIQRTLTELSASIQKLDTRLTAVEKLLLTHDAVLKDMVESRIPKKP